jgi:hypothetical protein
MSGAGFGWSRVIQLFSIFVMTLRVLSVCAGQPTATNQSGDWVGQLVIPVRAMKDSSREILATEKSRYEALLSTELPPEIIVQSLVLMGIIPPATQDKTAGAPSEESSSLLEICLSDEATGGHPVPLAEFLDVGGESFQSDKPRLWRFLGLPSGVRNASSENADKEPVVISTDPDQEALIAPAGWTGKGFCQFAKVPFGRTSLSDMPLFLVIRPHVSPVVVILSDRFGRLWLRNQEMKRNELTAELTRISSQEHLKVLFLYDPFTLEVDRRELMGLCERCGIARDRIIQRQADRRFGLVQLTMPEHRPELQQKSLSRQLPGRMPAWPVGWHEKYGPVDQIRTTLRNVRSQFESFSEQLEAWQHELKQVTTRTTSDTD